MIKEQVEYLKKETKNAMDSLERLEQEIAEFEKERAKSKKMGRIVRLIVSNKIPEVAVNKKSRRDNKNETDKF